MTTPALLGMAAMQTVANIGINSLNNKNAREQASIDRAENYRLNQKAAEADYTRQKALIEEYYTPEAQIKHLLNAGLSPSMMYGAGGTTGSASVNKSGAGEGIQTQLRQLDPLSIAQMQLMQAEANKANAEANTLEGNNPRGEAEIENLQADTMKKLAEQGLTKAQTALAETENEGKIIDNFINGKTKDIKIQTIISNSKIAAEGAVKALWEARSAKANAEVDEASIATRIFREKEQTRLFTRQILQIDKSIEFTEMQIKKMEDEIVAIVTDNQLKYLNYDIALQHLDNETEFKQAQKKYWEDCVDQMFAKLKQDKELAEVWQQLENKKIDMQLHEAMVANYTRLMSMAIMVGFGGM